MFKSIITTFGILIFLLGFSVNITSAGEISTSKGYFELRENFENPASCWPTSSGYANISNCSNWGVYGQIQLSQKRAFSGSNSAMITYTANETSGQLQRSLTAFSPTGYSTFYANFYMYFEPGFVFPADNKTLQVLREYDFQPMLAVSNFSQKVLDSAEDLRVYENGPNPYDYSIDTGFTITTGRWYHIEVEYVLDTIPPPNSNGIVRIWIDGTLKTQRTNVPIRATSSGQIEGFNFGINYSNGCCGGWKATGPIYKYFDDIYVAAGYTGPAPRIIPDNKPPAPPTGLRIQ